ncbi:MAG: hypothetical protein LKE46_16080 [Clostridium sp.]|jgi:hypothetical protein|uniref:hypothetical protein n=1 Tax=Clostridium sp. TaxID=1506 RepID=UPI0025C6B31E|nr:hypothetical protein [Clostridium sp.]MCH3965734.1 hypothetical protein [Clostridium sp.]
MENINIPNNLNKSDTSNLILIYKKTNLPIVQYLLGNPKGATLKKQNVFLANRKFQNIDSQCKSLLKLQQLKLTTIFYNNWYTDMTKYSNCINYENSLFR